MTQTILRIDSSGRKDGSTSRALTQALVAKSPEAKIITRDVAGGLPLVDEQWMNANFTDESERSAEQRETLALSDALVAELEQADVIIIGSPVYNFGIPASLKSWVDMIARARKTFKYTENGPEGLLRGKKAYIAMASGGTEIGSDIDYASTYLKHIMGFVGIDDVTVIAADQQMARGQDAVDAALAKIDKL